MEHSSDVIGQTPFFCKKANSPYEMFFFLTSHLFWLLRSLSEQGSLNAAEPKLRKNLSISQQLHAPSDARVTVAMQDLAHLLNDKVSTFSTESPVLVRYRVPAELLRHCEVYRLFVQFVKGISLPTSLSPSPSRVLLFF